MNVSDLLGVMGILIEPLKTLFRKGELLASITLLSLLPYSINFSDLLGVMGILIEVIEPLKILFKNGKLLASITLLTLLPYSLLLLRNYFSTASFIFDFAMYLFDENTDVEILVGIECIFTLAMLVVFLLSMVSTVYTLAVTYSKEKLTLEELFIRIKRTCMNLAITCFYVSLMSVGCSLPILAMVRFFTMVTDNSMVLVPILVLSVLLVLGIKLKLSAVWVVGLMVTVLEDGCYGLEALRKAEELVKGRKLQGFIITLVLVLVLINISGYLGNEMNNDTTLEVVIMLTNIIIVWKIYSFMTYTVFYYECKNTHEEEVDEKLSSGYSLLPTIPHVGEGLA